MYIPEVSTDRIKIGYPAGYLGFFRSGLDLDIHFWKKLDQNIGFISITNFSESDSRCHKWWLQCFLCYVFLCCQYVLHSSQSMVIRVTLVLSFSSQVEVVRCSYISVCCFVCCAEWHMCVLCRLIVCFIGGQLVFDWDRLRRFPDSWSVIKSRIQYHIPKLSITCANTVPLWCTDRRQSVCYA